MTDHQPAGPAMSRSVASHAQPGHRAPLAHKGQNGDIVQVGYNTGWGGIQNNHYAGRVARAIPSHGGELPGGMQYPFGADAAAAMGMGGGMGMGGPGCAGGACGHNLAAMGEGASAGPMPGQNLMPRFTSGRTQVRFTRPTGMKIGWSSGGVFTSPQLEAPARYNFQQAQIYRLKLTDIVNRPGMELYPTLEVYPGNAKVDAYLAHNAVPIEFTDEDFDQVAGGNFVSKVIYLPDPKFQELAIAGVETLVSTRLDPGIDPVQEASRRGAILAVLRIGSVDLEMSHSPELFQPAPAPMAPAAMPPGAAPIEAGEELPNPSMMPETGMMPETHEMPEASVVPDANVTPEANEMPDDVPPLPSAEEAAP
jgi:hypothetical protein